MGEKEAFTREVGGMWEDSGLRRFEKRVVSWASATGSLGEHVAVTWGLGANRLGFDSICTSSQLCDPGWVTSLL